jgi:uncharacterized Ntn-hydrolase superfamily protein
MTFSIAAKDPATGKFGIAIATSAIAVGNRCPWVLAGVGAVTTQHRTDTRAGPVGIDLLKQGLSAAEVVRTLAASNDDPSERQFAAVDRAGNTAFFCGPAIPNIATGHQGNQCVATGNFLANHEVTARMVQAYDASPDLEFGDRLMAALDAGVNAGGETKPVMSAALLIAHEQAWPLVDLRVDFQLQPEVALRALWDYYKPHQERFVSQVLKPSSLQLLVDSPMNV